MWYEPSYRVKAGTYGFPERPQELEHFTQKAWARTGGIFTLFQHHTVQGFFTAGTAENSDALTSFRLGSALPFRSEFPLILHGYYVEEVFARRFWLLNLAYRFPVVPDSERIQLQLSFDYARVDYASGHELPRHGLRGVGIDLSLALTKQIRSDARLGLRLRRAPERRLRRPGSPHPHGDQVLAGTLAQSAAVPRYAFLMSGLSSSSCAVPESTTSPICRT